MCRVLVAHVLFLNSQKLGGEVLLSKPHLHNEQSAEHIEQSADRQMYWLICYLYASSQLTRNNNSMFA